MNCFLKKICFIIPVVNPGPELLEILEKLSDSQAHIIVVNDGSDQNFSAIFAKAATFSTTILLNHKNNLGKGAALKSAFFYFLNNLQKNHRGVVCLDGDGQHLLEDVVTIAKKLQTEKTEQLLLGSRNFSQKVRLSPARS